MASSCSTFERGPALMAIFRGFMASGFWRIRLICRRPFSKVALVTWTVGEVELPLERADWRCPGK